MHSVHVPFFPLTASGENISKTLRSVCWLMALGYLLPSWTKDAIRKRVWNYNECIVFWIFGSEVWHKKLFTAHPTRRLLRRLGFSGSVWLLLCSTLSVILSNVIFSVGLLISRSDLSFEDAVIISFDSALSLSLPRFLFFFLASPSTFLLVIFSLILPLCFILSVEHCSGGGGVLFVRSAKQTQALGFVSLESPLSKIRVSFLSRCRKFPFLAPESLPDATGELCRTYLFSSVIQTITAACHGEGLRGGWRWPEVAVILCGLFNGQ